MQPGGTGVILAGTGDPNDALDSYYGAGILLSEDQGTDLPQARIIARPRRIHACCTLLAGDVSRYQLR